MEVLAHDLNAARAARGPCRRKYRHETFTNCTHFSCGNKRSRSPDTAIRRGEGAKLEAYEYCTVRTAGRGQCPTPLKVHIAEYYRRAEEYMKRYHRASSLDEREVYLSAARQFLLLAKDLEKGPDLETRRSG
jgi:hypothetical protein